MFSFFVPIRRVFRRQLGCHSTVKESVFVCSLYQPSVRLSWYFCPSIVIRKCDFRTLAEKIFTPSESIFLQIFTNCKYNLAACVTQPLILGSTPIFPKSKIRTSFSFSSLRLIAFKLARTFESWSQHHLLFAVPMHLGFGYFASKLAITLFNETSCISICT